MIDIPKAGRSRAEQIRSLALHDVAVPENLEQRILASLASQGAGLDFAERGNPFTELTRRGWMAAAIAASFSGVMMGGSGYLWLRRPLLAEEIQRAVQECLATRDWVLPWNTLHDNGDVEGIPFPEQLKTAHGWQYRKTRLAKKTVAYDVSILGCPAVLFAIETWRDISDFDTRHPEAPVAQTGAWKNLAIWQQSGRFLYVLALQGTERDYRLLTGSGPASLA